MKFSFLFFSFLILSLSLVSALDGFGIDDETLPKLNAEPYAKVRPINYSLIPSVNSSDYWDGMDTINTTQMENSGGVLNILESWLGSFGNDLWCKLTGCDMTGNINMTGNNITGVNWLYADNVNVSEDLIVSGSTIYIGNVTLSAVGNVLNIANATVVSSFEGEGGRLFNLTINVSNGTVYALGVVASNFTGGNFTGDYFNGNYFCNNDGTNCSTISDLLQTNQIGAFEENITVTVSGGSGSATSNTIFDYLITQITVTPTSSNNNYRFEAIESTSGDMIDRDRIPHTGTWDIYKSHSINDAVNISISNANIDENFNVRIKYVNNYLA